ncbi:chemokine-like receptor 1 [Bufo bufo]|uniref:chemokine-like receptor 1 n=1 Tax=Bufo bufo TaxID=8384 RepID=UPI001ABDCC22|nr:chemokine-like receptor 1 [Bufo bufo]XP_040271977.1 chemokine-like receptor 1 [Bufo bufo]
MDCCTESTMNSSYNNNNNNYNDDYYYENGSLYVTDTERENEVSISLQILPSVLYSAVCILGVIGNGLVIGIVAFKMKKSVNTIWLLNLALADFMFSFSLPLTIVYTAMDHHWIFGKAMCKMNSFILFLNMFTSILILTTISLDRCITVIFPVWSQNHRSIKPASLLALGAWMIGFLLSTPSFIFRDTEPRDNSIICFNNYTMFGIRNGPKIHAMMTMIRFVFGYLIPLIIITISYAIIVFKLKKNHMAKSGKPFKIIFTIIVAFFICWSPYHILHILEMYQNILPSILFKVGLPIATALASANSCINPILYVIMGQDFRKFKLKILSRLDNALSDDTIHTRHSFKSITHRSSMTDKESMI